MRFALRLLYTAAFLIDNHGNILNIDNNVVPGLLIV